MFEALKSKTVSYRDAIAYHAHKAFQWLSDGAHRRSVVGALLIIANHIVGRELIGVDEVMTVMDVLIGASVAAWSPRTAA